MWNDDGIKSCTIIIIVAAALLTACSTSEARDREALMDLIERQARLPDGARPLAEYARYYAPGGKDEVAAVFLIPVNDEVGQRRWMDDQRDLPFIIDGGCSQVTLTFDRAKSVVKAAECNGPA